MTDNLKFMNGTAWFRDAEMVAFLPEDKSEIEFIDGFNKIIIVKPELFEKIYQKMKETS